MKIGEILREITDCNEKVLIEAIGEILGEKGIILSYNDINLNIEEYISLDIARNCKAIPFDIDQGRIKVCFSDTANRSNVEKIRLLLLNKGLIIDKYITFEENINNIINMLEGKADADININSDTIKLIDTIIKTAMKKRASDIHIEPMEDVIRVRYRIDGELIKATEIKKETAFKKYLLNFIIKISKI
mgnify:CR=1 FL=1